MKYQYIGVIVVLAFLAACAPKHNNNLATRLSEAQRQILKKPTPNKSGTNSTNTNSSTTNSSGTNSTTPPAATTKPGTTTPAAAAAAKLATKPAAPATAKQQAAAPTATAKAATPTPKQLQNEMTVTKTNSSNTSATNVVCRLSSNPPLPPTSDSNSSVQSVVANYYAGVPLCDSANVTIAKDGEVVLPQNPNFQTDSPVALTPVKVSSSGNISTFTFQSLTPKTGRLALTYLLPGVDAKSLAAIESQNIPVTVNYGVDSQKVLPQKLLAGSFKFETVSTKSQGDMVVLHLLQASDLKYANYTLTVQIPNQIMISQTGAIPAQYLEKEQVIPSTKAI